MHFFQSRILLSKQILSLAACLFWINHGVMTAFIINEEILKELKAHVCVLEFQ